MDDSLPPLPPGATLDDLPPLPKGATLDPVPQVGGRNAPPGISAPAAEPFKETSDLGEYFFGPTQREEISGSEALASGGVGAAIAAGAPKVLRGVGKVAQLVPQPAVRAIGKGTEALGTALQTTPLWRRLITGGAGGGAADVAEQAGEYEGIPRVVTLPVSMLVGGVGGYTADLLSRATGIEARQLASGLRGQAIQLTQESLEKAGLSREQAQAEIARLQKIQQQISGSEKVSGKRVAARETKPFMSAERESVYSDLNAATRLAQEEARAAGLNAEQTRQLVEQVQTKIANTEKAVSDLEARLVAQPSMSRDQFGTEIRNTTQQLYDDAVSARRAAAPFKQIISQAGNEPTVSTERMYTALTNARSQTGNPTVRTIIDSIRSELLTSRKTPTGETELIKQISLARADSLKGYIDSIIHSKQFGETKLSKEITSQVRKTKGYLFDSIRDSHPEYMEALSAFRVASRPLDIVERNGGLAKVVERDPLSTEYVLGESEVVGKVIARAKAGSKVFERLIDKNPTIKDSARLYFVRDLFGKESAPTEAAMRTWLKNNESVLKRTGLYDEFRDIRVARTTANRAVAEAKGELPVAKQALTRAEQIESRAEETSKKLSGLSKKAGKRLQETLKTAEPIEDIVNRLGKRARSALPKIEQQITGQQSRVTDIQDEARALQMLSDDLSRIRSREIPNKIKQLADDFAKKGRITPQQADQLKRDADANRAAYESATSAAKRVAKIVSVGALFGIGGSAYKGLTSSDTIGYNR